MVQSLLVAQKLGSIVFVCKDTLFVSPSVIDGLTCRKAANKIQPFFNALFFPEAKRADNQSIDPQGSPNEEKQK